MSEKNLKELIETHFEMLMPLDMQTELGVSGAGDRPLQLRVMRVISHCYDLEIKYEQLRAKIERLEELLRQALKDND